MSAFYTFKEGFSGFKRARLSTFISITTLTIALLLLGLFSIIYMNTETIIQSFRDKVEMEVFLEEPMQDSTVSAIQKQFLQIPGIISIKYISKVEAAKIFRKEFGEDIYSVLDFNPLPASFKLQLDDDYKNSDSAAVLHQALKSIKGVDDVIYRKTLLEILDRRVKIFISASAAIGSMLLIAAIFLVSNTIRLTIYAKRKMITTMKLVGATRGFIRMPFLIEGMLQGFFGGVIASGLIYSIIFLTRTFVGPDLSEFFVVEPIFYAVLLLAGILLGLLGSGMSVKRFISENIVLQ
jgi:cell division transport system permease protein